MTNSAASSGKFSGRRRQHLGREDRTSTHRLLMDRFQKYLDAKVMRNGSKAPIAAAFACRFMLNRLALQAVADAIDETVAFSASEISR